MTQKRDIYRCSVCGSMVEVVNEGAQPHCCGQPMQRLGENDTDGAREKHVPVVTAIEGGYHVCVGSEEHPMLDKHYIQWIELQTENGVMRRELKPGDRPEATFLTKEKAVKVREYCNLHGLWKG